MKIVNVKIEDLKDAEYNPRSADKKDEEDLKNSLKKYDFVLPIVVNSAENRKNIIIGGHFRKRMAKEIGKKEIPVVYVNIPDIDKEKELNLRLNKNLGSWDYNLLHSFNEDMLLDIGFEQEELEKHLLGDFDNEEIDVGYKFGDINSWVRIGDFCCEIKSDDYEKIKGKIEDCGGIENFLNNLTKENG